MVITLRALVIIHSSLFLKYSVLEKIRSNCPIIILVKILPFVFSSFIHHMCAIYSMLSTVLGT